MSSNRWLLTAVIAVGVAGCGGGKHGAGASATSPPTSSVAERLDASSLGSPAAAKAKSVAQHATTAIDRCLVDGSLKTCADAPRRAGLRGVRVVALGRDDYVVRSTSRSGTRIEIMKDAGRYSHACAPANADGCAADGGW